MASKVFTTCLIHWEAWHILANSTHACILHLIGKRLEQTKVLFESLFLIIQCPYPLRHLLQLVFQFDRTIGADTSDAFDTSFIRHDWSSKIDELDDVESGSHW